MVTSILSISHNVSDSVRDRNRHFSNLKFVMTAKVLNFVKLKNL